MSATGLGVTFWQTAIPFTGTTGLMHLADRNYTITHVFLSNISQISAANVELGITLNGQTMSTNDSRKFLKLSLAPMQVFDLGSRIGLPGGWSLMGTSSVALGDEMVYACITGEVSD